jgi:hypothetical protein
MFDKILEISKYIAADRVDQIPFLSVRLALEPLK